jgi:phospholipid-binding lipoprotein MlaA
MKIKPLNINSAIKYLKVVIPAYPGSESVSGDGNQQKDWMPDQVRHDTLAQFSSQINVILLILIFGVMFAFLTGCAAKHPNTGPQSDVVPAKLSYDPSGEYMIDAYDPLEDFNRVMYNFNSYFDKYIFLPVVAGYAFVTPDYVEDRISNFFNNLREIKTLVNCVFQLKPEAGGITIGRFITNSTIGLAGFYDPATYFGWIRQKEDFGQTLGVWGVGAGPYLVLPVFGPSSFRDGTGLLVDSTFRTLLWDAVMEDVDGKSTILMALNTLNAIDARHRVSFRYHKSGSPFEYELVRRLYLDIREIEIAK